MHSHDSFGLGHLRRTLTLAEALTESRPGTNVLITTGSPCATQFDVPAGVEVVKLPSVTKDADGAYVPRSLNGGMASTNVLRRAILDQVFETFDPHLLVVDHQPTGLDDELLGVLRKCRERGVRTILGMRDVIDDPARVALEWSRPEVREALRELYDRVCVYGTPEVFDTRAEYPIPVEIRKRVEFAGYVVRRGERRSSGPSEQRPQVLVTLGGGEDGESRVLAYLEALAEHSVRWDSTIVLGPLMHKNRARHVKRQARRLKNVRVRSFYADLPRLLSEADAVVSMAGYNTVAEILQARTPAVLLPRTYPRREQQIRARRLANLGLARTLEDPAPAAIREAVEETLASTMDWKNAPSMTGCANFCAVVDELLPATQASRTALEA